MAALKDEDVYKKITQEFFKLYEKPYPNKAEPILNWFCCESTEGKGMDKNTLIQIGVYDFFLHFTVVLLKQKCLFQFQNCDVD